eukprot:gene7507-5292_t
MARGMKQKERSENHGTKKSYCKTFQTIPTKGGKEKTTEHPRCVLETYEARAISIPDMMKSAFGTKSSPPKKKRLTSKDGVYRDMLLNVCTERGACVNSRRAEERCQVVLPQTLHLWGKGNRFHHCFGSTNYWSTRVSSIEKRKGISLVVLQNVDDACSGLLHEENHRRFNRCGASQAGAFEFTRGYGGNIVFLGNGIGHCNHKELPFDCNLVMRQSRKAHTPFRQPNFRNCAEERENEGEREREACC